jgi:F0F1-type ATP synthase alpha subunit
LHEEILESASKFKKDKIERLQSASILSSPILIPNITTNINTNNIHAKPIIKTPKSQSSNISPFISSSLPHTTDK